MGNYADDKETAMWLTIKEACDRFGISERTLRRRISKGTVVSKKKGNLRFVLAESLAAVSEMAEEKVPLQGGSYLAELVEELKGDKGRLQKQVMDLQSELKDCSNRHDTIVLQLTRQLDQSQRLLEYHREPFWRKWFKPRKGEEDLG